ncbi:MAG: DUF1501 domain-containing protein [Acidobacteria bacterium]|nr:DUF1501 domain-containing protein [Acidobacteriota bacterium]MBI3424479.1 DUF1501 domain-containing protein [Acidobacteriota bacterium]
MNDTSNGLRARRNFLLQSSAGLCSLALTSMLAEDGFALEQKQPLDPLAPKPPHHRARAKSVIFLFMEGGPSHLDTFDPKPELLKLAGQPMPESFGRPITAMGTASNTIMPSKRVFKNYGQSGIPVSDWLPHTAEHADDLAIIRSCWADGLNHVGSVCQMNTGSILAGRPSLGAWATYGLGTANQNLPTFVVMADGAEVLGGTKNWSAGFLPAVYQGTQFRASANPVYYVTPPETVSDAQQRGKIDFLAQLNRRYSADKPDDSELLARLNSYELAYRMQAAAPEAVDLSKETEATKKLYGIGNPVTDKYGTMCLLARRLVERDVRFIQLYSGSGSAWDAHNNIEGNHSKMCASSDQPIAGLLTDLKARGLLDTTLVVWGGEFGRTPFNEKGDGRDHNPWGFTMWMAGAGIKGGQLIGTTDEIGLKAIEKRAHVHDLHATILHLMGLNQFKTAYKHNGRLEVPTVVEGRVIPELIA